jgi:hypothetical protein
MTVPTAADRYKAVVAELVAPPPPPAPSGCPCRWYSCGLPRGGRLPGVWVCGDRAVMKAWEDFGLKPFWVQWWLWLVGERPPSPWDPRRYPMSG